MKCAKCCAVFARNSKTCPACGSPIRAFSSGARILGVFLLLLVVAVVMGPNAVDEEETPLPPKHILPKPPPTTEETAVTQPQKTSEPTTIDTPAIYKQWMESVEHPPEETPLKEEQSGLLASLAEPLSTATPANGSTLHPSIKGGGAYITVNMVVLRGQGYEIALGRELAPVVKLIYESIGALDVVNWIVEVPYEDSYGNQGSRLLATFKTSRFRVDMINWDRFKDRNLVKVVEKLNWIPER
jgi:hypothetical protein